MNHQLVEGATHPELIERLLATKDDRWQRYQQQLGGTETAARMVAGLNGLDRREPFDSKLRFPESDENILTRLGEEGVLLTLDRPCTGPFGSLISRATLPARWSAGIRSDDEVTTMGDEFGLDIAVADKCFRYTRSGLRESRKS